MPKINVYLPEELAEAVKESGVPVSAICQRALEQAVRRVTAIRETALGGAAGDDPAAGLNHFTGRARATVRLAVEQARAEGATTVGTEHLLGGLLAEGGNLALHILPTLEIDLDQVQAELVRRQSTGTAGGSGAGGSGAADRVGPRFSGPAANALELTVTEATSLGHNYVGCEHLLLGLIAEPDGGAGQILRSLGAEYRLARRAVSAALAGYVHLRAQTQPGSAAAGSPAGPAGSAGSAGSGGSAGPVADPAALADVLRRELGPIVQRIERLERRIGTDG